ncbi:invasion associated locus B family protein [Bradyrhizobium diazoefficiens]
MARSHRQSIRMTRNHATAQFALLLLVATTTMPASAEISPRGQRMANDIKYGDWRKLCFKPGGAKTVCRTSITGTFDTGQTAVRLDLIEREGDRTARLQMFVPVGMFVQVPVKLTVDKGNTYAVPYTWCLNNACIAARCGKTRPDKGDGNGQDARAGGCRPQHAVGYRLPATCSVRICSQGAAGPNVRPADRRIARS